MDRRDAMEDSRERDRRFRRAGWRRAWAVALGIVAAAAVLCRIGPPEEAATVRRTPHWTWLPPAVAAEKLADVRAVRSPTVFALPSPEGFTGALRSGNPRLTPPVGRERAVRTPGRGAEDAPEAATDWSAPEFAVRRPAGKEPAGWLPVFANRGRAEETARMEFPEGWEQRLFTGVDLAYADWAPGAAWEATAELAFDEKGIPVSVFLDRRSGIPEVDRRIARSAASWRLMAGGAPRRGKVSWRVPAGSGTASAASAEADDGAGAADGAEGGAP
jgi:hypothetical protein